MPATKTKQEELLNQTTSTQSSHEAYRVEQLDIREMQVQHFRNKLPIGIFMGGQRLQNLEFNPYTTSHDILLSKKSNEDIHVTLGRFFPEIIKSIGGIPVKDIAKELSTTPKAMFERMNLADALAVVLNIRLETVGSDIAMQDRCPQCGTHNKDSEDVGFHQINEVDMNVLMNAENDVIVDVPIEDGFELFGDHVDIIQFRPFKLYQSKELKGTPDKKMDLTMMMKMISGMPQVQAYEGIYSNLMTDEVYTLLSIRDRNILMKAAKKLINIGPSMSMKMECESCSYEWTSFLPWQLIRQFCSESADSQ